MLKTRHLFPSFNYSKSTILRLALFTTFFMFSNEARAEGLGRNIESLWTFEFNTRTVNDFALAGDTGYVLKSPGEELFVFDLTSPTTATLAGMYSPQEPASFLAAAGNFVFLSEGSQGIEVVVSRFSWNPTVPSFG